MQLNAEPNELVAFHLEWVNRPLKSGAAGYYRRVPRTREHPTAPQAKARLAFSEAATGTYGMKGTVKTLDRREVSGNVEYIGNEMRNRKFKPEEPKLTTWERILCKILTTE